MQTDAGIKAIRIIGESIDVDRVEVFQLVDNSTGEGLDARDFMGDSPYASPQFPDSKLNEVPNEGLEEWFVK